MSTRISVCIANYNGAGLLRDCLDSVFSQQVAAEVEIIVHDDASTDTSLQLLRSEYPSVRLIASGSNVGFCISNNRMAEAATGDYLLLLNNDAALQPGALAALLAEQQRINGPCILTLPQYDWESGALVDRGCLLDPFYNPVPNLSPHRHDVAYVIGACLWCPSETWLELGGFPDWMESIGEDLFLCCVARLRGIPVRVATASFYRHRQGASFGGNRAERGLLTTYKRRWLSERNKTSALIICTPTSMGLALLLLTHLLTILIEGLLLSLLKQDVSIWAKVYKPLFAHVIAEKIHLMKVRREVQGMGGVSLRIYAKTFVFMPQKIKLLLKHGMPEIR